MWRTQMWQVRTYDMSGEWWMPTVGRRVLGISFLQVRLPPCSVLSLCDLASTFDE